VTGGAAPTSADGTAPPRSFWAARAAAETDLRRSPLLGALLDLWTQLRRAQAGETSGPVSARPQARRDRDALLTRLLSVGGPVVAPHVAPLCGHDPALTQDEVRRVLTSFLATQESRPQEKTR